ncbi:MAG: hypothetical protein JHC33_12340 [Ignisphaera sp.]|nr:hypothetical protein [Ignisphaera sp.]
MAEEQSQGNIKQELNSANIGLNLDSTLNQIKQGTLTYALNAALENFDSSSVNYQNEQGNEFCVKFPEEYVLIGTHFINEQSKHIFFITNPNTGDSEIGYMDNNDCIYRKLVNAPCLNFNVDHPIHKAVHKITNCTTEIYWTDGFNPRRYLDLNDIPYILKSESPLCDPKYTDELDCNQLKLQPNFNIPNLAIADITTGGSLLAGTYQFAAQYSDAVGNPFTSYYSITNPTPIADPQIATVNFNYVVGKSIVVDVSNLDSSGQFQYFNLAVIKTVNAITSVELIGTYFIDNTSLNITYTGQINDNIRLSMNDVFEKFPYYDVAEDLTAVQDVLVWDGLTSIDRINYQSIATQIDLLWETYQIPSNENYADELNATNLRGYLRDEVYAFEIVFLLKNGKQTDGFHIPGRTLTIQEQSLPNIHITNNDFIGEPEPDTDYSPYWKIYNTASVIGNATGDKIGNATPYEYGNFAYWESTEKYPCNIDLWGALADQPIRHHKFPDVLVSPITRPAVIYDPAKGLARQNNYVYPIGVKIDTAQVYDLIDTSNLTSDQKADIVGYKIVRGDRGTNKSIVAKGILRNVGEYTREEQPFYFPNYPYNDITEDPFLNANNNAWSDLCERFIINVLKLPSKTTLGVPCLTIRYVSCNSNKESTEEFTTTGIHYICSIGKPTITSPGVTNTIDYSRGCNPVPNISDSNCIGTVSYADYDVYKIRSGNHCEWPGLQCSGWGAEWDDPISGPGAYVWMKPGNSYCIRVKKDQKPYRVSGSSKCGCNDISLQSTVRDTSCGAVAPLTPISNNPSSTYRQIFNSPETSFGQPFLGDILKLENVMFGAGKAHFVPVKSNAKYRLLSKEAQEDALASSNRLAAYTSPFNSTAMWTAYQAYLQIYINGITRRNYAYSFNSTASYDYNAIITNSGDKQRTLDIKRYLIPGVQNVGDDRNVNNYQRESSVYLKTDEYREDGTTSVAPLPFPSNSTEMASIGIKDRSRLTIGGSGRCATPAREQDITVVSYYASLKNTFVNQYGQMYSYDTIDTGFQRSVTANTSATIFGGDTFISRFAFKTKLPFFIDNRVNAPDDSDIFYDEIGNIAYPKYWHSARSILSDYTAKSGTLSNVISYKAHEFDCPNDQRLVPSTAKSDTNPNRTFYDGYFYLFAYGIPNFYCESSYNTDLRQAFNNKEGDFWPHVSTGIPDDWMQEDFVSIANDNTYTYNVTFSKQNKENTFTHLPADYNGNPCYTYYPFRAVYSDAQNTDADNRVNSWLTYRAISYYDFPQNYGKLISLDGIQNKAVLARFENKTLMYNNLLTIDTSNPQAAYVGNPNMFKGAPPIDFAETDLGYVGSQNKMLLKIPQGQITVDAKRGQVFLIQGTQVEDLSAFGSGMNRFFTDHLAFEILRYFPKVDTDNNFNGIGLHGVYDSKFDRVILTKLDYIPLSNNIKYDPTTRDFYIEESLGNNILFKTIVSLKDSDYFCNKSWTLSFNVNTKSWVSFHSYIPNWYIAENNFFYSGINGCCDEFDFVAGELVPTPSTTTTSSSTSTTTTTSTTQVPLDCTLEGEVTLTNCELEGTGVITIPPIPPPCQRPMNLPVFEFITGYNIIYPPSTVVSTGSQADACDSMNYYNEIFGLDPNVEFNDILAEVVNIEINQTVYDGTTGTDCTLIPDGWYYTDETAGSSNVFSVVNGIITEIVNCPSDTTTTTTTSPNCFSFTVRKSTPGTVAVTYIDCSGEPASVNIGNPSPGGPTETTFCARNGSIVVPAEVTLSNNGSC